MLDLRALIHPLLARLARELRETTHMAVPEIGEFLRRTVADWSDGRAPAGPS